MRYAITGGFKNGALPQAVCVILLTSLLILSGCKGGGGPRTSAALTGSSGTLCLTDDYSYRVELDGGSPQQYGIDPDPLAQAYEGNIGGQIRGVARMSIGQSGEELQEVLLWGMGASVHYGTPEAEAGAVLLDRPGAVMDIAPISYGGQQMLVYGTERGVGIIGQTSSGGLADMASQGAWRSVPAGVLSLIANEDGSRILFTSRDGFLQQISAADVIASENCSGIVATKVFNEAAQEDMVPVKVQLAGERAFILSRVQGAVLGTAPTFDQAYEPIFKAMAYDATLATVSSIDLAGGGSTEIGYTAANGSFDRYDRFIPSDIFSDGQNVYVVGLAYAQASVGEFLSEKCTSEEDASDPVQCLKDNAKNGKLADYTGSTALDKFVAGFFVYRSMEDLSKADHFEVINISLYKEDENAPPFIYAIASLGDQVFVRGANFMVAKMRTGETSESWTFTAVADSTNVGLTTGLPNRILPYGAGAVSSFTAVRQPDGSGASELEYMDISALAFSVIDTGAIFVRVDGAGEDSGLVAAIEMASSRGGKLFLENAVTRKPIEISYGGNYSSHAAYDGTRLAFAWSSTGTTAVPEKDQPWRIAVQTGSVASSRGEANLSRSTGSNGEFSGFPSMTTSDPNKQRGVGGMTLSGDGSYVAVLLSGYSSSKWYHQAALYRLTKSGGVYEAPKLAGISGKVESSGSSSAHPGRVLAIRKDGTKYETIFSTADSVQSWEVTPNTSSPPDGTMKKMFGVSKFVDAAMDAQGSSKIAIVSGNKIIVKDADNPTAEGLAVSVQMLESTTLDKLVAARVGLSGPLLAIASPYGAAHTFSLYQVGSGSISLVAGTKLSRFFDAKVFRFFPNYLLASSQAAGIEIYDLSE